MTPIQSLKANRQPLVVESTQHNERNSLITMLSEGHRLAKRRVITKNEAGHTKFYPPMNAHVRSCPMQSRKRINTNSLDTTFHTTRHILTDDISLPTANSVNFNRHDPDCMLHTAKGYFTAKMVKSLKHKPHKSIDLSNFTNTSHQDDQNINALCLCDVISTNCYRLQSLCLHNCQIDEVCAKQLASIIMSKGNVLKSLNLSKIS